MFCFKKYGCSSDDLEQFVLAYILHLVCKLKTMAKAESCFLYQLYIISKAL